jgi:hypothetical protein
MKYGEERLWRVVEQMQRGWDPKSEEMDERITLSELPWNKGRERWEKPFDSFMNDKSNREYLRLQSKL